MPLIYTLKQLQRLQQQQLHRLLWLRVDEKDTMEDFKKQVMDMLVEQTHHLQHLAASADGPIRFTDTRVDEQQRGISLKMVPVSLVLESSSSKSYLFNFIDTPGTEHKLIQLNQTRPSLLSPDLEFRAIFCVKVGPSLWRACSVVQHYLSSSSEHL